MQDQSNLQDQLAEVLLACHGAFKLPINTMVSDGKGDAVRIVFQNGKFTLH